MPAANQYEKDNLVTVSALFKHLGTPTDPTSLSLKIKKPDGTVQILAMGDVVKDSTGAYHKDITANLVGNWYYYWGGTGAVVASSENYFIVKPSEFS